MNTTKAICYTLELKLPVLATDIEGEPNSAISHSYIPGALLRGALAGLYLTQENKKSFDAVEDATARALFLSDETRFLNAYPINENGKRALPTPLAWRYNKEDFNEEDNQNWKVNDLSHPESPLFEDGRFIASDYFQEQAVGQPFVWWEGGRADLFSPSRQLNVHTQRDAHKGRATGEEGTIYRYDALAAGLYLQGVILTTEELAEQATNLLQGQTLWLGRARRAGYGEALVTVSPALERWRESGASESPLALNAGEHLRVLCTSDVLLRDDDGQATLDPQAALARALNLDPHGLQPLPGFTWAETKIVGGFNRKWGLPLPQTVAIAAGSVFVYRTSVPLTAQQLRDLEWEGIGERRNEGFGRLLANWLQTASADTPADFGSRRDPTLYADAKPSLLSAEEEKAARLIAQRMLRLQLDNKLREKVNHTKLSAPPHKNQLARLRVILRAIQASHPPGQADVARLQDYLANLRDTARKQFENARVVETLSQSPLLEWLQAKLDQPKQEGIQAQPVRLNDGVNDVVASVDDALAQEYVLRLIDQALYRAAKEQQERSQRQ